MSAIPGIRDMSPQHRYETINAMYATWSGSIADLARHLMISDNTIRNALAWGRNPVSLGSAGRLENSLANTCNTFWSGLRPTIGFLRILIPRLIDFVWAISSIVEHISSTDLMIKTQTLRKIVSENREPATDRLCMGQD
jgi:plasmid maintenance system antidote protein VapI